MRFVRELHYIISIGSYRDDGGGGGDEDDHVLSVSLLSVARYH